MPEYHEHEWSVFIPEDWQQESYWEQDDVNDDSDKDDRQIDATEWVRHHAGSENTLFIDMWDRIRIFTCFDSLFE